MTGVSSAGSWNTVLACIARLFVVWQEPDLAWNWLVRAVDAGYWSEPELTNDRLMNDLRARPGYSQLLEKVRANYRSALAGLRGLTVVRRPAGEVPDDGWPVLLCLHGYGADHNDLVRLAEVAASEAFFAITVSGLQPVSRGRFSWPDEGAAISAYLRDVLQPHLDRPECDETRVFTTGFSQGGLVAT